MLSDRCPVCLSVLPVTLLYCGQTVGWIKMKLEIEVGLGPGHTALDGEVVSTNATVQKRDGQNKRKTSTFFAPPQRRAKTH